MSNQNIEMQENKLQIKHSADLFCFLEESITGDNANTAVTLIDKATAQFILDIYKYKNQRLTSERGISLLASEMRQGRFVQYTQLRFEYLEDLQMLVLIDGYHRLSALITTNTKHYFNVLVTRSNSHQVQHNYANIDQNTKRTVKDQVNGHDLLSKYDISKTDAERINAATNLLRTRFHGAGATRRLSNMEILKQIEMFVPEAKIYLAQTRKFSLPFTSKLQSSVLLACGIITYCRELKKPQDYSMADKFWSEVIQPTNLSQGSPTLFLRDFLIKTGSRSTNSTFNWGNVKKVPDKITIINVATAWEKFLKNQKLRNIPLSDYSQEISFYLCSSLEDYSKVISDYIFNENTM